MCPQPEAFVAMACSLVRPNGVFVLSTLNRTAKSFMLAIVGAEYVLRWLPRGTHRWDQFQTPEEITVPIRKAGLKVIDRSGMVYDPTARPLESRARHGRELPDRGRPAPEP